MGTGFDDAGPSVDGATRSVFAALVLLVAVVANGDPKAEFRAAYEAYRDAVEGSLTWAAVRYAEEARRLGEEAFPEDSKLRAKLVLNYGVALAMTQNTSEALPVLKQARKRMREAFGRNAEELVEVELALLKASPGQSGRIHRRNALRLARRHHPENSHSLPKSSSPAA